ncbi:cadherin-like protein 26 isoform X2 [Eleutherodactylus coqui]|uniref:cadherin-like protein 26 isoform X2 n=1 Tax=Eleutherodactylus coqui TaxID=57060 RepID=UPI00346258DC
MRTLYPLLVLLLLVHGETSDSLRPLRRFKRRWVLTTIVLEENDAGPFPKHAGNLFNDRSNNYSITYLISGPGVDEPPEVGLFHINERTGAVYVNRPIDREKTPLFVLRFDAAEAGTGSIVDRELLINIEIQDLNDNAPVFTNDTYETTLKETADLDKPFFKLTATDSDKEETINSTVTYYMINEIPKIPNVEFRIDPDHGLIYGKGCLDYQAAGIIRLIVGARDNGKEPMVSTTTVTVRLQDGNNNMPVFTPDKYELSLHEGEVKNNTLRLKVEDKDAPRTPGWRAKYTIISGNEKDNYNLVTDPETNEGVLNIVKPLDFEGDPTKTVVVAVENEEALYSCVNNKLVMDKTTAKSTATLRISVIDTNDAPVFSPSTRIIREKEGVKPGTVLGKCNATDTDIVPNKIRYKVAEDPAGWVTVDENTGVLTTIQELDRESPYVNRTVYKVVVHAIDDGEPAATGTGTVLIYLSDINDNAPRLVSPYIQRCEQQNMMPLVVEAADKDLDPYAGPFKFEVPAERSRSVEKNWNVRQRSDRAVEILMLQNLKKGNYTIPLQIYDRQGTSSRQVLNVRVCSCPDGENCERLEPAAHQLGGGGIGAIIGALLFFLLALGLLVCFLCGPDGKKHPKMPGTEEGNQTLIQYNEEGGSVLSQASPAVLVANGNGNTEYAAKDREAVGSRRQSSTFPRNQYPSWDEEAVERPHITRTQSLKPPTARRAPAARTQSWNPGGAGSIRPASRHSGQSHTLSQNSKYMKTESLRRRPENMFVERIGDMLNERLHSFSEDDNISTYRPRTYAYEGELEPIDAIDFPIPDNSKMDFSFLDDFDPKFSRLEEICKK